MASYRVGIAGVVHGHVTAHLRQWGELDSAEVVAVADSDAVVRRRIVEGFELGAAAQYDSIEAMLETEELDVISVCTDTVGHADVVEVAAARGVHSIVEKPLAVSLRDADRMYAAAGKYGVQVLTTYPTRWPQGPFQRAVSLARSGALGRVYEIEHRGGGPKPRAIDANTFFRWLYDPARNGAGAFVDYCCYGADLACEVLGTPATVYAIAGRWVRDDLVSDDNARMLCTYPRGTAQIEATWTAHDGHPHRTLLVAEGGTLALRGGTVVLYDPASPEGRELADADLPAGTGDASVPANLLRSLEEGVPTAPWAGIAHHRDVAELLDAGLRSARSGAPVHLPLAHPTLP
jgi:predicted dehydrogenase